MHTHCCTQLWCAHDCLWTHVTCEWCTPQACIQFATLHVWCTGTVDTYEMHWICSWVASSSILLLMKYMSMFLLINMWKHTYNVDTRVKPNSYVATYSLNHISYFICWMIVEVDSRQKHFIVMEKSIEGVWSHWIC